MRLAFAGEMTTAWLVRHTGACVGELTTAPCMGGITTLHYGVHATARHLLGAACDTGSVMVWDTEQRAVRAQFVRAHAGVATAMAMCASAPHVVLSGGDDGQLMWMDLTTNKPVHRVGTASPVSAMALKVRRTHSYSLTTLQRAGCLLSFSLTRQHAAEYSTSVLG
jgi:hypothetical protein